MCAFLEPSFGPSLKGEKANKKTTIPNRENNNEIMKILQTIILKAESCSFSNPPLQKGQIIIHEHRGKYHPSKQCLEDNNYFNRTSVKAGGRTELS